MTKANECTCPSGDGSLRHPCPAHPASVELAGVAANLTFINGRPAMCGCQVEYSSGGGEYSDVIYVTLCAKHSGSAILDLVATNRIALTPEYEGQWHADLYLDREIPLAKAEGATPAEAVLALMSAERIDPEQGWVEQAGGDERAAFRPAQVISYRPGVGEVTIYVAGRVPGYMNIGDTVYVSDRAPVEQPSAALAQPSPVRSSLLINGYQLRAALDFIAPDGTAEQLESEACIEWRQQDADFLEAGLYAFCAEYPEEGGVLLDEEPTTAQPSPLQSEQAEAERPEMSPERAAYFMRRFKSEEKLLGPNEQAAVDYVLSLLAQHDRIVGALRAENAKLSEALDRWPLIRDSLKLRLADALARVEQQERTIAGMNEAHAKLAGLYEAAQAQHSVPELLEWAVGRWHAEVSLRPLINVHRRALDDTWRQVIRRLGGDTGLLCGPSHDELLAAAPAQGGE
ncbi:hypothetical protein ACRS5Q_01280 [Pseudomonas aeruginosa]|uniref:hypothetical protein n=1 Tax=Pseudomonas aeruginosa TaxID=287 RepID=UPI003EE0D4A6